MALRDTMEILNSLEIFHSERNYNIHSTSSAYCTQSLRTSLKITKLFEVVNVNPLCTK